MNRPKDRRITRESAFSTGGPQLAEDGNALIPGRVPLLVDDRVHETACSLPRCMCDVNTVKEER
jgi:hypothetical protein